MNKDKMKLEVRKLADLKPAEYNPRVQLKPGDPEFEDIARSIEELGYVAPIVVNSDGTIISGHQRCSVMMYLGYEEAEVAVVNLDKDREKAANIALNKITGKWDKDKLTELLIELDSSDLGAEVTGFHRDELSDLIAEVIVPESAADDEFDEGSVLNEIKEPRIKRGEIWQLGRHFLMCGDSTDEENVKELAGTDNIDLVVTDPPYNVNYEEKVAHLERYHIKGARKQNNIDNDHMDDAQFYKFLKRAFTNMNIACKPGAVYYVFHGDAETLNFRNALIDTGFKISECLIWEKNAMVLGRQDYHWRHEPILYGWKMGGGTTS